MKGESSGLNNTLGEQIDEPTFFKVHSLIEPNIEEQEDYS